jgi:hypothetical protein
MRLLAAHCHRSLGALYIGLGRRDAARIELSAAIDLYRAMDMTFWLPQTEAALAQAMEWVKASRYSRYWSTRTQL